MIVQKHRHFTNELIWPKTVLKTVFLVFSIVLAFISGSFSEITYIEDSAHYIALYSSNNEKSYFPLTCQAIDSNNKYMEENATNEFRETYGIFKENRISFAPLMNAQKQHDVFCDLLPESNYSFMFLNKGSCVEYNNHFKHEYYPIELLFESHEALETDSICYISAEDAERILISLNIPCSVDNYCYVIGKEISIIVDNRQYIYKIGNIFLNDGYYCEELKDLLKNYLLVVEDAPQELELQYCYFFNKYTFQNYYFMKRLKRKYNHDAYTINYFNSYISNDFDTNIATNFYFAKGNNGIFILFLSTSLLSFLAFFIIFVGRQKRCSLKEFLLLTIAAIIPYVVFFSISISLNRVFLFSFISCILVLLYYFTYIILVFAKNKKTLLIKENDNG